ncbi:ATP-binding SpoIIE family protein phosphatase [Vibrio neptunius]|uniref:Fused response regulator/phosphatase n=1 Tax=Vibrio neptunius TaxID=170651 RepID=A0ABS3A4C2_9VIBR|nr:fused response regulator/phosphatase [Vibrio neptunius]MBN3492946.1 fused response regulator/phosphatase [Vibrio neptunius]MBN3515336.1 fused response regulator/phosphatase [Vibrio neptunius]MBN3549478.1 fused response regulator/phosphatase [Vibrio neptunius]MBN3577747.1 fused response regulator/phosphatase [Vibrio neptunius]MCH9871411.1 fused response regulator/phosphatase [Vibrio neptunius]
MHVMIVDDHATNRELCRFMLGEMAKEITTFENGEGVVDAMSQMSSLPDVILLDVMMPVKDGFTTAKEIREAFPKLHIPIIFLTVLDDHDSFERCLTLGEDFIPKPVERSVLVAKVQAHYRTLKMHNEVKIQRDELSKFHEQVRYDYAIAESIFSNLMDEMSSQVKSIYGINYISTPSTVFNGDLIVVANRPHGGVYVMIADATGHGLPAAISAIPATRAFFSMASKGLSLGEIVRELNDVLVRFLPMGMMLAASVFEIRANGFEVSWWGGGLPDGYLLDRDGSINRKLVSTHMPLGVLKAHEFEADLVHFKMEPDQKIVCYTDGVIEAENSLGEQYGQERLEQALTTGRALIPTLFESVRKFASRNVGDDLSILAMEFPISNSNDKVVQQSSYYLSKTPVQSKMHFPAGVLKSVTIMNEVRQFLTGVMTGPHLDLVCSVLSELFANAIEHGLLHLDSTIKEEPDGFFTFYQLREEKLKELSEEFWVTLLIDFKPEQKQLVLELEHNGVGFDYRKLQHNIDKSLTHGRGIVLASELCDSLNYSKQGKRVKAVYSLDAKHHFPSSA